MASYLDKEELQRLTGGGSAPPEVDPNYVATSPTSKTASSNTLDLSTTSVASPGNKGGVGYTAPTTATTTEVTPTTTATTPTTTGSTSPTKAITSPATGPMPGTPEPESGSQGPGTIATGPPPPGGPVDPLIRTTPQANLPDSPEVGSSEVDDLSLGTEDSVESRIDSILDKNSDLMKRAGALGSMQANQAGALSSSMGARAAQSSVLDAAESIAAADSATAARYKELGYSYDTTIGRLNEEQGLKFDEMDKEFGISSHIMDRTEAFQAWSAEKGWDADKTADIMKMYTSVGNQLISSMAGMSASSEVTTQEQTDVMNSARDLFDSIFTIGSLDLKVGV